MNNKVEMKGAGIIMMYAYVNRGSRCGEKRQTLPHKEHDELAWDIHGFTESYDHQDSFMKQKSMDREILQLKGAVTLYKQLLCTGGVHSEQKVCNFLGIKSNKLATLKSTRKLVALKIDKVDFYPAFQFSEDGNIVDHFSEILGLLNSESPVDSIQFFLVPESDLNDMAPIEAIKCESDLHLVKRLAKQLGRQVAR